MGSLLGGLGIKGIALALGALLIVSVVTGFWLSYQHTLTKAQQLAAANATQAQQLDTAEQVNGDQRKAFVELSRQRTLDLEAVTASEQREADIRARYAALQKEVISRAVSPTNPRLGADAIADVRRLRDATSPAPSGPASGAGSAAHAATPVRPASVAPAR